MAVYGMLHQLLALPGIWYCLSCRRFLQGCPNWVKPYELHRYLQNQALKRGIYDYDFFTCYRRLSAEFQHFRWRAAAHCFKNEPTALPEETWYQWLKRPLRHVLFRPVDLGHWAMNASAMLPKRRSY